MSQKVLGKSYYKSFQEGITREWCITNGLGSYAGSSIIGANTRKHHGLLIASLHSPVNRYLLLSKINETLTISEHTYSLLTNQRLNDKNEEGQRYLQRFIYDGMPEFKYYVEGVFLKKTICFERERNTVAISYEVETQGKETTLSLVPLFNYREHGGASTQSDLQFQSSISNQTITLHPEQNKDLTLRLFTSEGVITKNKQLYDAPLVLQTELDTGNTGLDVNYTPYCINVSIAPYERKQISIIATIEDSFEENARITIAKERERQIKLIRKAGLSDSFSSDLVLAADQFIVSRASTGYKTILAGLPWFTDWGRDTMIAMQGLTLITKRFEDAKGILRTFATYIKDGLVPNMFPDQGQEPLYNTVDASLWYFYSVHQYLTYHDSEKEAAFIHTEIYPKLKEIIDAYKSGTLFSIYMDTDGLIHAGSGLDQVTWMDVRVDDVVMTPRHGKPVEINALWYNALKVMVSLSKWFLEPYEEYEELARQVKTSFNKQFWNEDLNCLYDVVDQNECDAKIRPNQIYAVSLPYTMLDENKAAMVVETVLTHLYATYGLRSLAPSDPEYKGIYKGKLSDRDAAYHQGTAWAFPLGALVTAYVKVHHKSPESIAFARKLIEPLSDHLMDGCIGQIAEIFDGDEPHLSRGCYAQAWSVGEILRAYVEDILCNEK